MQDFVFSFCYFHSDNPTPYHPPPQEKGKRGNKKKKLENGKITYTSAPSYLTETNVCVCECVNIVVKHRKIDRSREERKGTTGENRLYKKYCIKLHK